MASELDYSSLSYANMDAEKAAEFEREQLKKVKDVMNRYAAIRNNHGEITDVLEENLHFYQDM